MRLRIRKEDAQHVESLRQMEDVFVIEAPEIAGIFRKTFLSLKCLCY
jgi:flavoprotein